MLARRQPPVSGSNGGSTPQHYRCCIEACPPRLVCRSTQDVISWVRDRLDGRGDLAAEVVPAQGGERPSPWAARPRRACRDGHTVSWSPTLLSEVCVDAARRPSSPDAAKLALLASLFGARSDVYATRWENASTGKAGWSPATRAGGPPADAAGLPAADRRGASPRTSRAERRSGSTRCCAATHAPCWRVTSTRGRGCSTRSPTSTPAMPTGCRRRWNAPVRANGGHVWVFFDGPVAASDAGQWGQRCCGRRCPRGPSWTCQQLRPVLPVAGLPAQGRVREPDRPAAPGRVRRAGQHVVPRPDDVGAVAGSVGVPVVGRPAARGMRWRPGRVAAPGRRRTGAAASRSWPGGRASSAAGDPGPSSGRCCRSNGPGCRQR